MIKVATGAALAVGALVGVSACSSGDSASPLASATPGVSGGTNVAETPSVQPSATFSPGMAGPVPGTPLVNPFGSTVTFTNNAKVTVGTATSITPSLTNSAGHQKGNRAFSQKVTLTNASTTESFQAVWVRTSASTDSAECSKVFMTGLTGAPQIVLRPGKSTSWKQGFSCASKKGSEVAVNVLAAAQYSVGETNQSAVFVGALP